MEKLLTKAKITLIIKHSVFLSTICFSLKHRFSDEVDTAGTDGREVVYNPTFFKSFSEAERVTLLAHEIMHVAFSHMVRRGNRDHTIWNLAADLVINNFLIDAGFTRPASMLYDPQFKGMSTEEVYSFLINNAKTYTSTLEGDVFGEDIRESKGKDKAKLEEDIKATLVRAATKAQMDNQIGNLPGEILRGIQDLINPKLNWKQILERFISEKAKEDYSWKKPNRRYSDVYLPSLYSETIPEIVIAIDTSGSIRDCDLQEMLSEVVYLWQTFKPTKLTLIDCDSDIHSINTIENAEDIFNIRFKGGGGSDCRPVFKYAEENNSTLVIYFTDMYLYFPQSSDIPTLWISYGDSKCPFGEIVMYENN